MALQHASARHARLQRRSALSTARMLCCACLGRVHGPVAGGVDLGQVAEGGIIRAGPVLCGAVGGAIPGIVGEHGTLRQGGNQGSKCARRL